MYSVSVTALQQNFKNEFDKCEDEITFAVNSLEKALAFAVSEQHHSGRTDQETLRRIRAELETGKFQEMERLKESVRTSMTHVKNLVVRFNSAALTFIACNVKPGNKNLEQLLNVRSEVPEAAPKVEVTVARERKRRGSSGAGVKNEYYLPVDLIKS